MSESSNFPLVFSGGSSKFPLHFGLVAAASSLRLKSNLIMGNSAGSIMAALVASGKSLQEIHDITMETDFQEFAKYSVWDFFRNFFRGKSYVNNGDAIFKFLDKKLDGMKFKDLPDSVDLQIMSSNITNKTYKILSKDTTPDMLLAYAVRMSISIPGFFKPVTYLGDQYVDGGLTKDYPVDLVPEDRQFLGSLIGSDKSDPEVLKKQRGTDWSNVGMLSLLGLLISFIVDGNRSESIRDAQESITGLHCINNYPLGMIDFSVSRFKKKDMMTKAIGTAKRVLCRAQLGRQGAAICKPYFGLLLEERIDRVDEILDIILNESGDYVVAGEKDA